MCKRPCPTCSTAVYSSGCESFLLLHSDLGHRLLHTREVSFDADEPNSLQARKLLQLQQSLRITNVCERSSASRLAR